WEAPRARRREASFPARAKARRFGLACQTAGNYRCMHEARASFDLAQCEGCRPPTILPRGRSRGRWEARISMSSSAVAPKSLTIGEGGLALIFAVTALLCVVGAAKAHDAPFAFHAYLGAAASIAAVFAIFNRYFSRGAELPPQEIDGKPNYQFGPIKLATALAVFWGIAGFLVGLWIALELAWPALNFDVAFINFGRLRPLHTSAVIFAFGGNVLIATSFYVVQKTCRTRIAGDLAPWFVVLGYNFFILIAGTGYLLGVTQ